MVRQDWLLDIVESSLNKMGYDGLCNPDLECGCFIGDLAPCDSPDFNHCCGGNRIQTSGGDVCAVRIVDA